MLQNTKWTPEEDDRLMAAVRKYGTQWQLVGKEINYARSQNAIIKRWHGYLRKGFEENPSRPALIEEKAEESAKVDKKGKMSEDED